MNAVSSAPLRPSRRTSSLATAPPLGQQIALVSGANRGIGLEVVRQLAATGMTVPLGSRRLVAGENAARFFHHASADVVAMKLDVTEQADIDAAARHIEKTYGRLDVLINHAGSYYDLGKRPSSIAVDTVCAAFETHVLGAWRLSEAVLPLMRIHGFGRIVNVSSSCGSTSIGGESCRACRVSKSALNTYTRVLAAELAGSGILVNAV